MSPGIISAKAETSSVYYERRAKISEMTDMGFMVGDAAWRRRLAEAVQASGKSKREVSISAGMGAGYVHSILSEGKDPTVQNLIRICDQIGVTVSHILYGYDLTPENEELLRLLKDATPEVREALIRLLRSRSSG